MTKVVDNVVFYNFRTYNFAIRATCLKIFGITDFVRHFSKMVEPPLMFRAGNRHFRNQHDGIIGSRPVTKNVMPTKCFLHFNGGLFGDSPLELQV